MLSNAIHGDSTLLVHTDGTKIEAKDELAYFGTTVLEDGLISRELSRRLGQAHADFRALLKM